jgi:predicted NodU family carbamoyl transferase
MNEGSPERVDDPIDVSVRAVCFHARPSITLGIISRAHASVAFATSPYERAAFLCVDGQGDDVSATIGMADSQRTEISYELAYDNGIG